MFEIKSLVWILKSSNCWAWLAEEEPLFDWSGRAGAEFLNDVVVLLSGDLNELVRAQRGIVAFDAYVSRDANVKREESVTKGTSGGHASEDAITIRGGSRKLQLERSVPSVIVLRNEDADDA